MASIVRLAQGACPGRWRPLRRGNESSGTAFLAANGFAPTPVLIETDGYTVFDGLIGYSFDRYSLTLNGRNIFDTEYYGTCLSRGDCFPGEGRTIQLRAGVRF